MTIQMEPTLEDPGSHHRDRQTNETHLAAAKLAKANPNSWVKVGMFSASLGTYIKDGMHQCYPGPAGTWETTTRKIEGTNGRRLRTLFVRYKEDNDE